MKLVTVAQMRALEAAAEAAGTSTAALMERAGVSAGQEAWILIHQTDRRPVLVLAGPGNNGGDGIVAARHLHEMGAAVHLYLLLPRADDDPVWREAQALGVPTTIASIEDPGYERLDTMLRDASCVLDAVLGTGSSRPIDGAFAAVLDRLGAARERTSGPFGGIEVIALDVPSGVDADTGAADPHAVRADMTVCFGHVKVGLYQLPARELCGEIVPIEIGIPAALSAPLPYEEIDARTARLAAPPRPLGANKGTFGRATIAGGSLRYPGAPRLAAEACARSGAGLTALALPDVVQPLVAPTFPDAIHEPLPSTPAPDGAMRGAEAARALLRALPGSDALLVGPGLGLTPATEEFVRSLLAGLDAVEGLRAVVLDADAFNVLASHPASPGTGGWQDWFTLPRVLTPHPGEMARLLRCTVAEVQAHRLDRAIEYARATRSVVVLKGAGTIVAAPDGRARISPIANPMLATGGTGDVLAGLIVGLIAQGVDPFEAASAAVYVHAECGARVAETHGAAAGLAQDLLAALPAVRKTLDQ